MDSRPIPPPTPAHPPGAPLTAAYARCIEASRRVRWDIERDVIRGRRFDLGRRFLPDHLSLVGELPFLDAGRRVLLSQLQARTYANMFGLIERAIAAKALELTKSHCFGDQVALEALVRLTDEELKHQALFRRLEALAAEDLPAGYAFVPDANAVAQAALERSAWAVLALTLDVEIFTLAHYRSSIEHDTALDPLWKDVFLFHWKEESQHAILDELEWRREHATLDEAARERGVDDFIALLGGLDGLLVRQAASDAGCFLQCAGQAFTAAEAAAVHDLVLRAYRWQYIASGVQEPRFAEVLKELATAAQLQRIGTALAPMLRHVAG